MKLRRNDFLISLNRIIIDEFLDEIYGHMLILNRTKYNSQFTREDIDQLTNELKNNSMIGWERDPKQSFSSFLSVDLTVEYKGNNLFIKETLEQYKQNYNLK